MKPRHPAFLGFTAEPKEHGKSLRAFGVVECEGSGLETVSGDILRRATTQLEKKINCKEKFRTPLSAERF